MASVHRPGGTVEVTIEDGEPVVWSAGADLGDIGAAIDRADAQRIATDILAALDIANRIMAVTA